MKNNDNRDDRILKFFEHLLIMIVISTVAVIFYLLAMFVTMIINGDESYLPIVEPSSNATNSQLQALDPATVDYTQYFTETNPKYTERFQGDLAQMAINLNYFDFDRLINDLYPGAEIECVPVEAMDGSTTYDLSFHTSDWQVELFTMIDNESCTVASWIDIYNLSHGDYYYEYRSPVSRLKPSNYVTSLGENGVTKLFIMERSAFADFIVLVRSGGLNQGFAIPFDMAKLEYQIYPTAPNPAND